MQTCGCWELSLFIYLFLVSFYLQIRSFLSGINHFLIQEKIILFIFGMTWGWDFTFIYTWHLLFLNLQHLQYAHWLCFLWGPVIVWGYFLTSVCRDELCSDCDSFTGAAFCYCFVPLSHRPGEHQSWDGLQSSPWLPVLLYGWGMRSRDGI